MLEPRRLATRAAATRMASLLGEAVGGTVGFRTRLDAAVSPATRIEVVTEGLLIRRLQSDPGLDGVAAVILDEVHERSLESDLALALCLRPAARAAAGTAAARDVGHRGRRASGRPDGRGRDRKRRPHVPGRGPPRGARHPRPARSARRDGPRRARRAGGARGRHPRLPARHGGDPPHPGGAGGLWCTGAAAARRPAAGRAGPRPAAGRTAAGGAGDLDRRDLADRAWRADRGRWRLAPGAAARLRPPV